MVAGCEQIKPKFNFQKQKEKGQISQPTSDGNGHWRRRYRDI